MRFISLLLLIFVLIATAAFASEFENKQELGVEVDSSTSVAEDEDVAPVIVNTPETLDEDKGDLSSSESSQDDISEPEKKEEISDIPTPEKKPAEVPPDSTAATQQGNSQFTDAIRSAKNFLKFIIDLPSLLLKALLSLFR
jgi:hypothetical protein